MLEPFVERLILYGSTARGEQTYNSDIDLLLVLTKTKELQKYKKYIYMLKSELTSMDQDLPDVDLNIVIGNDWEKNEDFILSGYQKGWNRYLEKRNTYLDFSENENAN